MIKDLSAKLIAAAAEINKKSYESYHAEQRALQEKLAAKQIKMPAAPVPKADPAAVSTSKKMAEEAEGTVPKTPREKELAAKSGHPKRITFGDVLKARGVAKEEVEELDEGLGHFVVKQMARLANKSDLQDHHINVAQKKVNSNLGTGHPQADNILNKHKKLARDAQYHKKSDDEARQHFADNMQTLHNDLKSARGVKEEVELTQEGWDDMMKASQAKAGEEKAAKGTGKFNKKVVSTGTVYTRKASTFDDGTGKDSDERRQDRERRKAMKEGLMATMRRISKKVIDTVGHKDDTDLIKGMQKQAGVPQTGKKPVAENMDTPGNSTHQCAIHVKSEQFGEGRCLTTQHAEPVDGFVEWYDVMFAEGIKRVNVADVEVLEAMSHGNHTKKKAK